MKRKLFTAVLVSMLSVCAMSAPQHQEDAAMSSPTPKVAAFRPNQVIVKYKDNSSMTALATAIRSSTSSSNNPLS